ncbi:MAG: Gx transporter family protein [Clostridia bacterium]|nr:Gx transporter family protein [Clostridia bacterium]
MMQKTRRLTLQAVMISLALALSWMERFIPLQMVIPLPGIKLGLANIVSLTALYLLGGKSAYAILAIRCLMGAIFSGSVTAFLFSITGGTLAMLAMAGAMHIRFLSIYGVSILGAAAHNIGQIVAAMAVMKSVYIGTYLPYLLIVAVFTGFATGAASAGVLKVLPDMEDI